MGAQLFDSTTKAEICKCKEFLSPGHQLKLPLAERQHEFHLLVAFSSISQLATNSWKLHNTKLLKALIEMEEDAISHALGLNYGIISECIIKYLALGNHYHMLCMNLNRGASSGLRRTNGNEILHLVLFQFQWIADLHTPHLAVCPKSVYHGVLQVLINWICSIYLHWTG